MTNAEESEAQVGKGLKSQEKPEDQSILAPTRTVRN